MTINPGATAAAISATQAYHFVTFDGIDQSGSLLPSGVHALQVDPEDMISLIADLPNSREFRYTGFAQNGAELIILGGAVSGPGGSAEISLMILIANN